MKRKYISILFALVLAVSLALVPAMVSANPDGECWPSIDGTLSAGEWDQAAAFPLVWIQEGGSVYTAYATNDNQFMYVAFNYPIAVGSDFASFNTYKQDTFEPETINAPCVTPWGPVWDTIVDEDDDGVPETWHREDPTARYQYAVNEATEMKVPLAELGLAPGDLIKTIFVLNAHMAGTHVYPEGAGAFDLSTYVPFSLMRAVDIDIYPNTISLRYLHFRSIRVAILSTADFNAPSEVDKASLTFGRTGDEPSLAFCSWWDRDVNGDGLRDKVCYFRARLTGFQLGDNQGVLKGKTVDGVPIKGCGSVKVIERHPRHHWWNVAR